MYHQQLQCTHVFIQKINYERMTSERMNNSVILKDCCVDLSPAGGAAETLTRLAKSETFEKTEN